MLTIFLALDLKKANLAFKRFELRSFISSFHLYNSTYKLLFGRHNQVGLKRQKKNTVPSILMTAEFREAIKDDFLSNVWLKISLELYQSWLPW